MPVNLGAGPLVDGWTRRLERWLYPPTCVLCGGTGEDRDLCPGCAAELPYDHPACPRCALPASMGLYCGSCLARPPPWDAATSLLRYAYPADYLLKALKYGGALAVGRVLGELLAGKLALRAPPQLIVPVPLHPARERRRGFNQAVELARPVAAALGVRLDPALCERVRDTPPQSGLDRRARRRNLRGAFALRRGLTAQRVAIVDDVVTTGATAAALTLALRRAGAEHVELWSAARATRDAQLALKV